MTEQTLLNKVRTILSALLHLDADEIEPENELATDLGADSLELAEFVMALEEEFDIEIRDEDTEDIFTVEDAVRWLHEHLGD